MMVSAGSAMQSAASFGATRYLTGSRLIARSASISPLEVIAANSPAIADALRVTTRSATTSGPTSRVPNQPIASALTDSAPYCLS